MKGETFSCPVRTTVDIIGGKWKILIIYNLLSGIKRFGEIKKLIPGITKKVLSQNLKELEYDGIVKREAYSEVPPKTEYSLTKTGKKLQIVFELLCKWGEEYMNEDKRTD